MAKAVSLKRFANVGILKRIDRHLLLEFLTPYKEYFHNLRNLLWPDDPDTFDLEMLSKILMSPDADTPEPLLDALYFVDGLADPECYDRILEEARTRRIPLKQKDPTPEDLTLQVWLADRNILERIHAEQNRAKSKKFQSYFAVESNRRLLTWPGDAVLEALEVDLNLWFQFQKKGRGARVFPFCQNGEFWFLVRHGQRLKRVGTVEADGESGSVCYRPEKFDVLIYYPQTGELAIHAGSKGERKIYCLLFGKHLFGDRNFFAFTDVIPKYTLQPLIENFRASLICSDVEGINHVILYELQILHRSEQKDMEIRRADDVFLALQNAGRNLLLEKSSTQLVTAKFRAICAEGQQRSVTITPPNTATFDREADNSMIHDWLSKRGFITSSAAGGRNVGYLDVA